MTVEVLVWEPGWFGSHCCVRDIKISSGTNVCRGLPAVLSLCSQALSSTTDAVLILRAIASFHQHSMLLAHGQQGNDHLRLVLHSCLASCFSTSLK